MDKAIRKVAVQQFVKKKTFLSYSEIAHDTHMQNVAVDLCAAQLPRALPLLGRK